MALQSLPTPDHLTITEDTFDDLRKLADDQNMSLSEALTQAIDISRFVTRSIATPETTLLIKRGSKYTQLTLDR